ncbi:MAG: hypothetical protein O3A81_03320 [bacterium]|nr:hypothetical protein [bacterium]
MDNFDGDIIVVNDSEIDQISPIRKVFLRYCNDAPPILIETIIFTQHQLLCHLEGLAQDDIRYREHLVIPLEEKLNESKRLLKQQQRDLGTSVNLLDLVMGGRLRVTCLLNSRGGLSGLAEKILKMMKHIRNNYGETQSYVAHQASSAAALIFLESQHRYGVSGSQFMWHAGSTEEHDEGVEAMHDTKKKLESYSTSTTSTLFQERIDAAIADPKNHRHDVHFTAEELHAENVLSSMFPSVDDLVNQLISQGVVCKDLIGSDPLDMNRAVWRFLYTAYLTEWVRKEIRDSEILFQDEPETDEENASTDDMVLNHSIESNTRGKLMLIVDMLTMRFDEEIVPDIHNDIVNKLKNN